MTKLINLTTDGIYNHFKKRKQDYYDEEKHCKLLINIMTDPVKSTVSAFCVEALICERTFYSWVQKHELFCNIYYFCKMVAREIWEQDGRALVNREYQMGTINYDFEYWKIIAWSRFGIGKTSKIKINAKETDNAITLYSRILKQASEGEFTASEFKQLMEAVNVGLNVYQISEMQKQVDDLRSDLAIMTANQNGNNSSTIKSIT